MLPQTNGHTIRFPPPGSPKVPDPEPAVEVQPEPTVTILEGESRPPVQVTRAAVLWAGRWLLADGEVPLAGSLSVTVQSGDGAFSVKVRSTRGEDERPVNPFEVAAPGSYFSPDERRMVQLLVAGPAPLKTVVSKLRIERSKCATLAGNLRDRGIITNGHQGYELTAGPWAELAKRTS